jgi:lipoteichoic acid synthase
VPLNSYLPGGSFLNDRTLFMPGLGSDDGVAVNIADGGPAARNRRLQNDYKRMLALTRISNKWALGLPKRKDAGSLGVIPNPVAAKAAGVR